MGSTIPYGITVKKQLIEQANKRMIDLDKVSIDAYLVAYYQPEDENYGSVTLDTILKTHNKKELSDAVEYMLLREIKMRRELL